MCVSEGSSTNVCNPAAQLLSPTKVVGFCFFITTVIISIYYLYFIFKLKPSLESELLKDNVQDVYPAHLSWRCVKVKSNRPVK